MRYRRLRFSAIKSGYVRPTRWILLPTICFGITMGAGDTFYCLSFHWLRLGVEFSAGMSKWTISEARLGNLREALRDDAGGLMI